MRKALLIIESAEWGNIHRSIYEGLQVAGLPCWPLVLPRDSCGTLAENSQAAASCAAQDRFGMVILVGPNDHLDETALYNARAQGKRVVSIQLDDPWGLDHSKVRLTGQYDEVLTSDPDCVARYQALGAASVQYMPFGYDPQVFALQAASEPPNRAILVGSAYTGRASRIAALRLRGINIICAGPGWPGGRRYPAWAMPGLFRSASICLNCADQPDGKPALKIRPFEVAGTGGGCLLTERWPGCDDLFTDGKECIYWSSTNELAEKVRWLLGEPLRCRTLSKAAYKRARAEHTWETRLTPHVARWKELLNCG